MSVRPIKRLLVANRSEIATRVFRSATELGIRTVAIYSHEDRYALHRFKADQAYQIGVAGEPIRSYLNIPEIVRLCLEHEIDAVHPGYGFLSENPEFAEALEEAGILFVGPSVRSLRVLGDKMSARQVATEAGVAVLGGTNVALKSAEEAVSIAEEMGFPVILKAAKGGGGRGMRVVHKADEVASQFEQAQREAKTAFGSDEVFVERFVQRARHLEVQLLGDRHNNLLHLYERDCSVQRRHQKVVELAPAPNLAPSIREELCEAALKIGRQVGYENAGTVEFLYDVDQQQFYFIEVNPRIQVEHTVTEEVTGIDLVRSQILVAQGYKLDDEELGLPPQSELRTNGFAMQCRVTTEDPENEFRPDYGRISHYRSAAGLGIRLDAGSAFSGAVVNPFYDSMLVKVTARGRTLKEASRRMDRVLQEFRIRGVKTNIPFLMRLVNNEIFLAGEATTRLIDQTPELVQLPKRRDRATKLLTFLAEQIVNGNPLVVGRPVATRRQPAPVPEAKGAIPDGSRTAFLKEGIPGLRKWIDQQSGLLFTDTTMRDAHQSLLATRVRTYDMLQIAPAYARLAPQLFSLEMWGGATFDTSMRFLKESPWQRLADLREEVPNILFQMLLRASNAVGYTNYPDNVVQLFVEEAADAGMDVFRVFDALNWVPNMKVAMDAVLNSGKICEASICYSGDLQNPKRTKYDLKYYVGLAKELESMGAHLLAIKDMAGLCKPAAARMLVKALREEVGIPIHFHTHDTGGTQAASILAAADEGLQIADAALAPLSGGTSQVNLNTLVEALRNSSHESALQTEVLTNLATYWQAAREFYLPFESQVLPATGDLYEHEMPGGQYTNLFQQARALGLSDRWAEVCKTYATVNAMLGDIVKVTPTSKAVGDMALFMVQNELTAEDVLQQKKPIAFPASVIDLVAGRMGQPVGGFPPAIMEAILQGEPALTERPGALMPPADVDAALQKAGEQLGGTATRRDAASSLLYEKVFADYAQHMQTYGDVDVLPTPNFFYGQEPGEEIAVEIERGKTLIVRYLATGQPHPDGTRTVFFELNGQPREVTIEDRALEPEKKAAVKADPNVDGQVGASMPGMVINVAVDVGDRVKAGQKLMVLEAMKMETTINAPCDGKVATINMDRGSQVEAGDLLVTLES
ncbi:2-oxoglutarate carboxylase small subunit [Roseimaritima multifibrata]|uniref:Pyruvate carboxylase n=1 Tax=Roseimaritima multifibrata TaxID=1930274 RepID=A0A517ML16_9BACT|nr:pyruvate carboxylase [Roseimaritima multifibrata]QDS95573.1 2-oxoglutarate carboxylase small subunit [Roseimaritima multifibrata]